MLGSFIANFGTSAVIGGTLNFLGSGVSTPQTDPTLERQQIREKFDSLEVEYKPLSGSLSKGTNERMLLARSFDEEGANTLGKGFDIINKVVGVEKEINLLKAKMYVADQVSSKIPFGAEVNIRILTDEFTGELIDYWPASQPSIYSSDAHIETIGIKGTNPFNGPKIPEFRRPRNER